MPYDGSHGYGYTPSVMTYDIRSTTTDFVDSTTFDQQHPLPEPQLPEPPPPVVTSDLHKEVDMVEEDIVILVSEAHMKTCRMTSLQIAEAIDLAQHDIHRQVEFYRNMVCVSLVCERAGSNGQSDPQPHEELWNQCANKLTQIIQIIIEFAKCVPGFMKLAQDDQIVLLKTGSSPLSSLASPDRLFTGSFELSCIRMSRYYSLSHDCVLFGTSLLKREAFITTAAGESTQRPVEPETSAPSSREHPLTRSDDCCDFPHFPHCSHSVSRYRFPGSPIHGLLPDR